MVNVAMRLALVTVLMCAWAPAVAGASVPFGDVRLGVLVAHQAWPDSPCNGRENITVSSVPPPSGSATPVGMSPFGLSWPSERNCRAWVLAGLPRGLTCMIVVHELGHLAGREHTDTGIMARYAENMTYHPCDVPGT